MNIKFVGMEKLSLVDYEGKLACTLFTNGCNFKCSFCHNSSLVIDSYENYEIVDEVIFDYLSKRKKQIDAVVITGGEPTLMKNLESYIIKIKELGYLVKLDTNGTNPEVVKKLIKQNLIDYIAMDIKIGPSKYPLITGIKNIDTQKIKETTTFIMESGIDYEFRTTLVKEFHELEDIKEMEYFIKGAKKIYLQCFVDNGNCIKQGLSKVEKNQALLYKEELEKFVDKVYLRNYE